MKQTEALKQPGAAVLPTIGARAVIVQLFLLAAAAFLLPAVAHAAGLPVRWLLPMHWPVIFAGLCYGWRSGAIIGLFAPFLSFLVSGMPLPHILPAMTVELAAYGLLAGVSRETFKLGRIASAAISLGGGRVVFLAFVLIAGSVTVPFGEYMIAAMLPGLPAAVAQLLLIPIAARWWVARSEG